MFDTVRFVHSLESEGISRGAAEAIAQGLVADRHSLATKDDIEHLRQATKDDIEHLRHATKDDIERLRQDLDKYVTKSDLVAALTRQVVQFGIMLSAGLTLAVAAVGVIVSAH